MQYPRHFVSLLSRIFRDKRPTLGALTGSGPAKNTPAVGPSSLKSMRTVNVENVTPLERTGTAAGVCGVEGSGVAASVFDVEL